MKFDINCDFGEGYGRYSLGNLDILDYISSVNIACGYHGGDPLRINNVISKCLEKDISVGAHPSYPDLMGFGRRSMEISSDELYAYVLYQISAVYGIVKANKGKMSHVKAHGALYHDIEKKEEYGQAFVNAVIDLDSNLKIVGLANGNLERICNEKGIRFVKESFSDRKYNSDLSLLNRKINGAVIEDMGEIIQQVEDIMFESSVTTIENIKVKIDAETVCIHGDGKHSYEIAKAISEMMKNKGIEIVGLGDVK